MIRLHKCGLLLNKRDYLCMANHLLSSINQKIITLLSRPQIKKQPWNTYAHVMLIGNHIF